MKLSRYFLRNEFECPCGCGTNTVDAELILVLECIRRYFDEPVKINSGNRCTTHNRQVGGVENSMHLTGKAADIVVKNIKPELVYEFLNGMFPNKYGIGKYEDFIHIDVRSKKARW